MSTMEIIFTFEGVKKKPRRKEKKINERKNTFKEKNVNSQCF